MNLFVTGDTAPALSGVLSSAALTRHAPDVPANLTGATLELHLRRPDGTVLVRPAVVTDAAAGAWSYTWQPGELVEGSWWVEVQVTYLNGAVQTFPAAGPLLFTVRAQLDGPAGVVTPDLTEADLDVLMGL